MRRAVEDLGRFQDWPDDPVDRPSGPMRFVEREVGDPSGSGTTTVRILQVWVFRQFNDAHRRTFADNRPRGVQRRGETGWYDVPLET